MAKRSKKRSKKKSKRRKNPKRVKAGKKAARKRKRGSKRRKKNKSTKPRKKSMAGKKGLSKITNNPLLKKVLLAAGAVTIATSVLSIVAPNQAQILNSPVVKAGIGFLVGDLPGAATNFVLAGGGGFVGNGGNAGNVSQQGNSGFA